MIDNVAISLFGLNIYWYGLAYFFGFLFSYFFILKFAKDFDFEEEFIEDTFLLFLIFSIFLARVFHITFYEPSYYFTHPFEIIRFDHGGMSIHGGILGGFLAIYFQAKRKKESVLKLMDLFILPISLGLAFGRLANFVNQELVGKVTNSVFGIVFPKYDNLKRWPVTLFESFKNLIVFQILFYLFIFKNIHKKPGYLSSLFLILYNFGRFFTDFFREPEVLLFFNISMGQFLCLVYGCVGVLLLIKVNKKESSN